MNRSSSAVLALAVALVGACSRHDNPNPDPGINADANPGARGDVATASRDSALVLGPGDLKIVNEDSSVDLAVVGQRIVVRLSDKTMAKVRRETDTSKLDSGVRGSFERFVKRTVQSALGHQVEYPLSDIRDARYENGEIVLETNENKQPRLLANTKVGGKKLLESFRPDDARRFVAAVNAKKSR